MLQRRKSQKHLQNNLQRCHHITLKQISPVASIKKNQLRYNQVLLAPQDLIYPGSIQLEPQRKNQHRLLHLHHRGYLLDWVSLQRQLKKHLPLTNLRSQALQLLVYLQGSVLVLQLQNPLKKKILTNQLIFLASLI